MASRASDADAGVLEFKVPRAFQPLAEALRDGMRFIGASGGRGSGKSHFFAERVVRTMVKDQGMRIACLREVQKSLTFSSKLLLEDKIRSKRLGNYFRILDDRIEARRGNGVIIFQGMQNHTAESIKSLEGFKLGWFSEAQSLSARSLELLTPTFRGGATLMFDWNPDEATDPVDVLFRGEHRHPRAIHRHYTFDDNPWFPDDLREDMEYDRRRDPAKYEHVWRGGYQLLSEARVFKNWRVEEFETPADAVFYLGADWGFSIDPTVLVRCFIIGRTLYIDREVYKIGLPIDHSPHFFGGSSDADLDRLNPTAAAELRKLGVTYEGIPAARKWPITADSARPETINFMQRHGFPRMVPAIKGPGSVQEGVEFLQGYDIVVHPRCRHTADELTAYKFKTDEKSGKVIPVLEDKKNHVIDALRYAIEPLRGKRKRAGTW
jgi:phage terminase large subunit